MGYIALDSDDPEKAQAAMEEAEAMFQEMGMEYWLERTRVVLQTVQ
jgi:hypothetical protein